MSYWTKERGTAPRRKGLEELRSEVRRVNSRIEELRAENAAMRKKLEGV
jgi:predicted nuclease with TOPRIM domain